MSPFYILLFTILYFECIIYVRIKKRGGGLNKIHYILDLTGIRMPDSVKAEAEKRINNAGALYEKKSGKKKAAVVLAFVFAFIMIVASVAMITKTVNSNRPLIPEITETEMETETDITETDAPDNNDEDEKYYVFDSLYKDYYRYDIFKTAVSLIKPYENDLLVTAAENVLAMSDSCVASAADNSVEDCVACQKNFYHRFLPFFF